MGNATTSDVLAGRTFTSVVGIQAEGTMPNNGATGGTITAQGGTYTIPAGYTSGGTVTASIPVSTISNAVLNVATITEATNDYGVEASITIPAGYYNTTTLSKVLSTVLPAPSSAITQSQMLSGYESYNNEGQLLVGTMTNQAAWGATLDQTTTSVTVPEGYHNGTGTVSHATVNIPDPTISLVNSTGVITASGSWTRGFTTDNSYTKTYTLSTQAGATITPTETTQTAVASYKWTTGTITVAAIPSDYVGSGVTTNSSADLEVSGATVTVPAGYYASDASASVTTTNHPVPTLSLNSSTGVITASHTQGTGYVTGGTTTATLGLTVQTGTTITPTEVAQTAVAANRYTTGTVTVAAISSTYVGSGITTRTSLSTNANTVTASAGYYPNAITYTVPAGTAKPQATISATGANVTVGNNTLTFTKSITLTPQVTAGYISAGTGEARTVTLAATISTKAAATYTPSTATQTIAAGYYLAGAQTIAPIPSNYITTSDATATASDIINTKTAYVNGSKITGNLVVQSYYTGTSAPSSALGNNGDIYFQGGSL